MNIDTNSQNINKLFTPKHFRIICTNTKIQRNEIFPPSSTNSTSPKATRQFNEHSDSSSRPRIKSHNLRKTHPLRIFVRMNINTGFAAALNLHPAKTPLRKRASDPLAPFPIDTNVCEHGKGVFGFFHHRKSGENGWKIFRRGAYDVWCAALNKHRPSAGYWSSTRSTVCCIQ